MAERLVEAARRYSGAELESMLSGLFEADLAIKANTMEAEPALVAWLGELPDRHAEDGEGRLGGPGAQDAVALDGEGAARFAEAKDADQLLVDVELAARNAQRPGNREEEALLGDGVLEGGVEDARQEPAAAEAAGLDRPGPCCVVAHGPEHGIGAVARSIGGPA